MEEDPLDGAEGRSAKERSEDAYARGTRDAQRDSTLQQHTDHLKLINGAIARTADQLQKLTSQVTEIESARSKETAISGALAQYLKEAEAREVLRNSKGITAKQLWISVIAIIVPVIVSIVLAIVISSSGSSPKIPNVPTTTTTVRTP